VGPPKLKEADVQARLRLLMAATALLYLGPLLAGLAGQGWRAVPPFVAVFLLWLVVMRPWAWPRSLAGWADPKIRVGALAQLAVQTLLVVMCFAIGRGLGGVVGVLPLFHPFLPLALSFLSLPLSRLLWDPHKGREMDAFVDQALAGLQGAAAGGQALPDPDPKVQALLDLPGDADLALVAARLDRLLGAEAAEARLEALGAALDRQHPPRPALRRAFVIWASDAARAEAGHPHGAMRQAFAAAGAEAALLRLFVDRALPVIARRPDLWPAFPEAADLSAAIHEDLPPDLNDDLEALADALYRAMSPGTGRG
jgi:hypothetical protein